MKERLVGTWRLVSFVFELSNGAGVDGFGPRPLGLLVHDRHDNLAAQIMNPDRPRFASGDRRTGTLSELHAAIEGYIASFGTYEIDEAAGSVIHDVRADLFPNAAGIRKKRFFELADDRLILRVPPVVLGGERMTATAVWARIGSSQNLV